MLAAVREVPNERVNEHVGRAGVKGKDLIWSCTGGNDGDIGDAAEVQRNAAEFCVAIEKVVGIGNKRRALAAECDIRGTKICDGGDSRARRNDGWLTDLKRRSSWRTEIRNRATLMEDGLAMAADERNA